MTSELYLLQNKYKHKYKYKYKYLLLNKYNKVVEQKRMWQIS